MKIGNYINKLLKRKNNLIEDDLEEDMDYSEGSDLKQKFTEKPEKIVFDIEDDLNSDNYQEICIQREINYIFDKMINIVSKKVCNFRIDTNSYKYYKDNNQNYFTEKNRQKIKKYLERFFRLKKYNIISKFSKTYHDLNCNIDKLSDLINRPMINSYNEFMEYGISFYNSEMVSSKSSDTIKSKKEDSVNLDFKLKKINKDKVSDVKGSNLAQQLRELLQDEKENSKDNLSTKKVKITTQEVENLKSERRKLLLKINKINNELKTAKDLIKQLKEKELLLYKKNVYIIEKQIYDLKKSDDTFKSVISDNQDIRRKNAIKSIENYFKSYQKGIIKDSLENYFGTVQIEYFKSLGLDLDNMNVEKRKTK